MKEDSSKQISSQMDRQHSVETDSGFTPKLMMLGREVVHLSVSKFKTQQSTLAEHVINWNYLNVDKKKRDYKLRLKMSMYKLILEVLSQVLFKVANKKNVCYSISTMTG